ncbi:hypothetical protein MSG28_013733 [Choristoneura fumiferana]|uniref:Uncharacterized protein n=1 Tax=Choristoneura fumiferana TaxID=7141 RepID=A0ACC0K8S4_CHOFU|nr:hypothetical protein MSG28_013733 [Choristoneura fumiferana]
MCSLKGQTRGVDILNVLLEECSKTDLSGVATDVAPSMIGVNSGLVTLLKKHLQEKNINAEDLMHGLTPPLTSPHPASPPVILTPNMGPAYVTSCYASRFVTGYEPTDLSPALRFDYVNLVP